MVKIFFETSFEKTIRKIKDSLVKVKIKKQIKKVVLNPEIGKPMMYNRKGTREIRIAPYRLSYIYLEKEDRIVFLDIYHKDEQ